MAPSLLPTAVLRNTPEAPTEAHPHTAATADPLLMVEADLILQADLLLPTVEADLLPLTVAMVLVVLVLDPLLRPDMEVTEAMAVAPMVLLAPPPPATVVLPVPPDPTLLPDPDTAVPLPRTAGATLPALPMDQASHVTLVPPVPPRDTAEALMVAPPSPATPLSMASAVLQALTSPRRSATKTHTTSRRSPDTEEFPSTETPTVTRLVTLTRTECMILMTLVTSTI